MTATVQRPAAEEAERREQRPAEHADGSADGWIDLAATLGLAAFSLAVAVGFSRVFSGSDFLADLAVIVAIVHGLPFLGRRLRLPAYVVVPVSLAALVWVLAFLYLRPTMTGVFPTGDTWEAARASFTVAREEFRTVSAPVPYESAWGLLGGLAFAVAAWLSDIFAFRANARGESLVPGAVLFVFIAALGVDERRTVCSLAVVGAGFVTLALLRLRTERRPRTVLGRDLHPLLYSVPAIAVVAALVVGGSWALGPALPGAGETAVFDTRGEQGTTDVVSPMIDIRARLVNDAETELFRVRAGESSYWRLSALPRFDGSRWDLPDGELDELSAFGAQMMPGTRRNEQVITIDALGGSLVPAAPEPISASGPAVGYNDLTATLVKGGGSLDDGDTFEVMSAMPRFDAEQLRQASTSSPPSDIFFELPGDLPPVISTTAAEVTAGGATSFEKAVLLQDWFRAEFEYSTEVPEGHSNSAIVDFLENRVGYCEQFAGTYAAMARSQGIPARVAVGFTQGEVTDDGEYLVRGRNAHAWPEIWFDGFGWVPFEPTPGRGLPGAEAYTGIPPQQDEGPTPSTTTTTAAPTTTVPDTQVGAQPPQAPPTPPPPTPAPDAPPPAAEQSSFPWLLVLLVVVVVGTVVGMPALVRRWRRRSESDLGDPASAATALWERSLRSLRAIGFRPHAAETTTEVSAAAGEYLPEVAAPISGLGELAGMATYAPPDVVAAQFGVDGDRPHEWCQLVEQTVNETLTIGERVRRYFTIWS